MSFQAAATSAALSLRENSSSSRELPQCSACCPAASPASPGSTRRSGCRPRRLISVRIAEGPDVSSPAGTGRAVALPRPSAAPPGPGPAGPWTRPTPACGACRRRIGRTPRSPAGRCGSCRPEPGEFDELHPLVDQFLRQSPATEVRRVERGGTDEPVDVGRHGLPDTDPGHRRHRRHRRWRRLVVEVATPFTAPRHAPPPSPSSAERCPHRCRRPPRSTRRTRRPRSASALPDSAGTRR